VTQQSGRRDETATSPVQARRNAVHMFFSERRLQKIPGSLFAQFRRRKFSLFVRQKHFGILCVSRVYGSGYTRGTEVEGVSLNDIFFDAPLNFVLTYKHAPLALIGFAFVGSDFADLRWFSAGDSRLGDDFPSDTILVKQLQGVRGAKKRLAHVWWEKLLLKAVIDWAFSTGFEEVRVVSAKESGWYNGRTSERKRVLQIRYKVTPRRMGFTRSEDGTYSFLRREEAVSG